MKHKVAELEGALLDVAVALAEGLNCRVEKINVGNRCIIRWGIAEDHSIFRPSVRWEEAGPIIERERIAVVAFTGFDGKEPLRWWAQVGDFSHYIDEPLPGWQEDRCGQTPLIAAMRAYVAAKFGAEVDLP